MSLRPLRDQNILNKINNLKIFQPFYYYFYYYDKCIKYVVKENKT